MILTRVVFFMVLVYGFGVGGTVGPAFSLIFYMTICKYLVLVLVLTESIYQKLFGSCSFDFTVIILSQGCKCIKYSICMYFYCVCWPNLHQRFRLLWLNSIFILFQTRLAYCYKFFFTGILLVSYFFFFQVQRRAELPKKNNFCWLSWQNLTVEACKFLDGRVHFQ